MGCNGKNYTYTVLAIGESDDSLGAQYASDFGVFIILPSTNYRTLYGDTQPLCTVFNIEDSYTESGENWISKFCEEIETNLTYISHKIYKQEFEQDKITYSMVGGVLAVILALIGILNFVNAVATSIITKQKELAMLGAVGMSCKQIKKC